MIALIQCSYLCLQLYICTVFQYVLVFVFVFYTMSVLVVIFFFFRFLLFFTLMVLIFVCILVFFFFFKQKTAYEMRISDWSSDVCSSDLGGARNRSAASGMVEHSRGGRFVTTHARPSDAQSYRQYCRTTR